MKYLLSEELKNKFPKSLFAFSIVKSVEVFGPDGMSNKILTDVYPDILVKYPPDKLFTHPHSIAYSNFAAAIGVSAGSAFLPHLQIKRILNGKQIGNINNIVNSYMALELQYNLSFASYDLDTIVGDITVDIAKGGEEIISIGGEKCTIPEGDLVFTDSSGPFYSFSQGYRDSSKITSFTKNVIFTIDAPEGISREVVEKAIRDLSGKFNSGEIVVIP